MIRSVSLLPEFSGSYREVHAGGIRRLWLLAGFSGRYPAVVDVFPEAASPCLFAFCDSGPVLLAERAAFAILVAEMCTVNAAQQHVFLKSLVF